MNPSDPNNAQAGFVSVVVGAGATWFDWRQCGKSNINISAKAE